MRIHDTLNLEKVYVSEALLEEISTREDIEVLGSAVSMTDAEGNLMPF